MKIKEEKLKSEKWESQKTWGGEKTKKKRKKKKKEMLTNALRAFVNNSFKESFYGKEKKKKSN